MEALNEIAGDTGVALEACEEVFVEEGGQRGRRERVELVYGGGDAQCSVSDVAPGNSMVGIVQIAERLTSTAEEHLMLQRTERDRKEEDVSWGDRRPVRGLQQCPSILSSGW